MPVSELTIIRLLLGAAGTVVYSMVGLMVGRRRTFPEGNLGIRAFQVWWYGLAILTLFGPLMAFLGLFPKTATLFTIRLFLLQTILVLLMVALGGLLYYLFYVYFGRTWIFWIVSTYVVLELSWLMTLINEAHAIDYGPHCPGASFCYENDVSGTAASTLLSFSFFAPILLATVAYFALFFRVEDRTQRLRIAMVAGSLLLWFGSGFLASFVQVRARNAQGAVETMSLSQAEYWTSVVGPLISLTASLVIYWAYRLRSRPPHASKAKPSPRTGEDSDDVRGPAAQRDRGAQGFLPPMNDRSDQAQFTASRGRPFRIRPKALEPASVGRSWATNGRDRRRFDFDARAPRLGAVTAQRVRALRNDQRNDRGGL